MDCFYFAVQKRGERMDRASTFVSPSWVKVHIYRWCNSIKLFIQTDRLLWLLSQILGCLCLKDGLSGPWRWRKKLFIVMLATEYGWTACSTSWDPDDLENYFPNRIPADHLGILNWKTYAPVCEEPPILMLWFASSCDEWVMMCILHSIPCCAFWTFFSPPSPSLYYPETFLSVSLYMACNLAVLLRISGGVASPVWSGMVT